MKGRWFVDFGLGGFFQSGEDDSYGGVIISGGYYLGQKNFVSAEIGAFTGSSKQIGISPTGLRGQRTATVRS